MQDNIISLIDENGVESELISNNILIIYLKLC